MHDPRVPWEQGVGGGEWAVSGYPPADQSWGWDEPEPEPTPGWEFVVMSVAGSARYERTYTRPVVRYTQASDFDLGLTKEEGDAFVKAIREARRGPDDARDPMGELRAEVERLRDEARHEFNTRPYREVRHFESVAYQRVLDLIDKHAGGGQ